MTFPTVHYSRIDKRTWTFKNFSPKELACSCCGEVYLDIPAITMLQHAREIAGFPFKLNSAHRCALHNARVGGAPLSQHKRLAFDVSTRGKDAQAIFRALIQAGFTTFGLYNTFIHTDPRPNRRWYGSKEAKQKWTGQQ